MSVSKKGRVQVRTGFSKPGAATYRAVDVVHVGPQRKQSEASNFERLARDLGQFNRSLQSFGNAMSDYAKRAEIKAEKLKKEKEAAQKRAKAFAARKKRSSGGRRRRSGGGGSKSGIRESDLIPVEKTEEGEIKVNPEKQDAFDKHRGVGDEEQIDVTADPGHSKEVLGIENTTKQEYKNFTHATKVLGPQFDQAAANEIQEWRDSRFKRPTFDEDGEPTGETTMTISELNAHYAKKEAQILVDNKDNQLAARALLARNSRHRAQAERWLLKYEQAERVEVAKEFNQGNVAKFVRAGKEEGLSGDKLLETVQERLVADGAILNPNYGKEDAARDILTALEEAATQHPTMAEARTIMEVVKASPGRTSGVSELFKHPKFQKKSEAIIRKLSKGIARTEAETKAKAVADIHLKKVLAGETPPRLATIQSTVNGEAFTISVKDQLKAMATELESRAIAPNEDGIPLEDDGQVRDNLIASFSRAPHLVSPKLKSMLGMRLVAGQPINMEDPIVQQSIETATSILNSGPGGIALLSKYVPKHMVPYYQMIESLDRAGLMDKAQFNEVFSNAVTNKKDGFNLNVPKDLKPAFKDLEIEGLNAKQTAQVAMAVKMTLKDDDTVEDVQDRILKVAESYKTLNPTRFGVAFKIPSDLTVDFKEFKDEIDWTIDNKVKELFPEFKDKQLIPRLHGDEYYLYDKKTNRPIFHPDTAEPMAMPVRDLELSITQRKDRAAKEADEARRAKEEAARAAAEKKQADAATAQRGDKAWNALYGLKARDQVNQSQKDNPTNSMWAGLMDLFAGSYVSAEDRRNLVEGPTGEQLLSTVWNKQEAESMMNDIRASRRNKAKQRADAIKISGGRFAKNQRKIDREQFEAMQAEGRE